MKPLFEPQPSCCCREKRRPLQQGLRIRATTADGRTGWHDAEIWYVFKGPLDLAIIKMTTTTSGFVAATLQRAPLRAGEAVTVVSTFSSLTFVEVRSQKLLACILRQLFIIVGTLCLSNLLSEAKVLLEQLTCRMFSEGQTSISSKSVLLWGCIRSF